MFNWLRGELGLSVLKDTTTANVIYELPSYPPQYFARNINGIASYTSEEGNVVFQSIQIKAIYLFSKLAIFLMLTFIIGGFFIF